MLCSTMNLNGEIYNPCPAVCDSPGAIDCVDLSYPSLHFLSYLAINDIKTHHAKYVARCRDLTHEKDPRLPENFLPMVFLNFVRADNGASGIRCIDANSRMNIFPFLDDEVLYSQWHQSLEGPAEVLRVLVALPRGECGTFQIMTALVHTLGDGDLGIQWLYCQSLGRDHWPG